MTSSTEAIERLHWESFLGTCGYETSVKAVTESMQKYSLIRRGKQHDFEVSRRSRNSIQLTAADIRFPIARLLGCVGFRLHPNESRNVAFEIFEIKLGDDLFNVLGELCVSITPDTITTESDEIIEQIYKTSPSLLLPAKGHSRVKHIFAHFGLVDRLQFLAVSSDKYNYDDWMELETFKEIRKTVSELGGKRLEFLAT